MNLFPMRNRIAVLQDPIRSDVTPSGILIAAGKGMKESQSQLGRTGTVMAAGPEVDADQLKVGDRIVYGEFDYPEYAENGIRYIMMQDADICGVME